MNQISRLFFVLTLGCALSLTPPAHAKAAKHKAATAKSSRHTSVAKPAAHAAQFHRAAASKSIGRRSGKLVRNSAKLSRRGKHARQVEAAPPVAGWRRGQMEPSPDRYREIQQALASKGYLKTEPTGSWDAPSQDALKRFQADQKLDQSGAITAKSLIALGLGPAKQ